MTYYNRKWDPTACCLKAIKETRLLERKVHFIFDTGTWCGSREWYVPVQGLPLPTPPYLNPHPTDNQGVGAFIDRGRGLHAERAVSSDSHLEINHQWSDQHHLDCFRYS